MGAVQLDSDAIPKLIKELDMGDSSLSGEEGFLLSRVDGRANVSDLCKVIGLDEGKTHELLAGLVHKGYLEIAGCEHIDGEVECKSPEDDVPEEDRGKPWVGMKFNPFDLNAEVDIDMGLRKRILYLFDKKDELNHYQMLELDRRAEAKEVKRAYFRVSKDFHPDSYFRKDLGVFKSKIEALFKRISTAYEVLGDAQKRGAYDKTLPYEPTEEEKADQAKREILNAKDARLKNERRQRLMRRMPMTKRRAQARKHFEAAKEYKEAKRYSQAANAVRLALALVPDNEEYKALEAEVAPQAGELRADKEYKRGRYEEEMGNLESALRHYETAVDSSRNDVRALQKTAKLMLKLERDLRKALSLCRRAQEIEPDYADAAVTMGDIYQAMGMYKNALREYGRYRQLSPLDDSIQKKIDEMKKKLK